MRAHVDSNDEIGELAKYFNIMVDRLEAQIRTLDEKVREKTAKLEALAVTDPLTQLYNRRYFTEISNAMFAMAKRQKEPLSIIMLDIDHFKKVNDTYGHLVGDRVIRRLADVIRKIKRESDIACRFGGEEFILLLPKTDKEGARELAERIRMHIASQKVAMEDGAYVTFTVSAGVSESILESDQSVEESIRRADDAMYKAKRAGRNSTCVL
jgi:diguanylate cyclase (GGDEF)-like protein